MTFVTCSLGVRENATAAAVKEALERTLDALGRIKTDRLRKLRWAKYEAMGSEDASLSELESAYSSSAFMSKILLEKRHHARELEHKAREARRGKDEGKPDEKPGEEPS